MKVALIVAMDEQGVIGRNNDLPWRLSADLQYFRKVTMGKPLIMGRNTHESIGRPLPGRRNIVITRQQDFQAAGCDVVFSIEQALALCEGEAEVMIMGGASLYEQTLPLVDTLYLTRVHTKVEGDTWFPDWSEADWQLVSREDHQADAKNEFDYSFLQYERIRTS